MTTKAEYTAWAQSHLTQFGAKWEDELATLLAWHAMLAPYTAEQLTAATRTMFFGKVRLATMDDHRRELLAALRAGEAVSRSVRKADDVHGVCEWCQGEGWVPVPHPFSVRDGQWMPYRSAAGVYYGRATVTCSCAVGDRVWQSCENAVQERMQGAKRPMKLVDYECNIAPHWRAEVAERQRLAVEERTAARVTQDRDRERLRAKFVAPEARS